MNARMIAALIGKDFKLYFANRLFAIITVLGLVAYVAMYYLLPNTVDETLELGLYMREMPPALEELLDSDEVKFYHAESEEALKQAVIDAIPTMYAQATEKLYVGLWNRTTSQLRGELDLKKRENPRDKFGEYALIYTRLAEKLAMESADTISDLHGGGSPQAHRLTIMRESDLENRKRCARRLAGIE